MESRDTAQTKMNRRQFLVGVAAATTAAAGAAKRELAGKAVSPQLGELMDKRAFYRRAAGAAVLPVCEGAERYGAEIAAPILCEGDVVGAVLFLGQEGAKRCGEAEEKLARAAAHFLGRLMEG